MAALQLLIKALMLSLKVIHRKFPSNHHPNMRDCRLFVSIVFGIVVATMFDVLHLDHVASFHPASSTSTIIVFFRHCDALEYIAAERCGHSINGPRRADL